MKKRIIIAFTVLLALSLGVAVYALNNINHSHGAKMDCCQKSDNCPMKNKQANGEKTSCCDKDDCCCKGGNCPMKAKSENASMENCPMMKKSAENKEVSAEMQNVTVVKSDGENCCNGCDCCGDKKKS